MSAAAAADGADDRSDREAEAARAAASGDGGTVLSSVGFVRLGGAVELVAIGLLVASFVLVSATGLTDLTPAADAMDAYLTDVAAVQTAFVGYAWILTVEHLLEIVFLVALYRLLREAGTATLFALLAGVAGLLTVAISGVVLVGIGELAGSYATADAATRPGIVAVAVALERMRVALSVVGTVLAWGVGGAVFSVAILQTGTLSRWLGWGGLAVALLVWVGALQVVVPAFEAALLLGLLVGGVWLVAMGIALVRIDPDLVPSGEGPAAG